jgi:hypothetical protein
MVHCTYSVSTNLGLQIHGRSDPEILLCLLSEFQDGSFHYLFELRNIIFVRNMSNYGTCPSSYIGIRNLSILNLSDLCLVKYRRVPLNAKISYKQVPTPCSFSKERKKNAGDVLRVSHIVRF